MKKIYILFFVFVALRFTLSQDPIVSVEPYLSKLYTWNFNSGKYVQILNKNGAITKNYPGGIFLAKFYGKSTTPKYIPVHKPKGNYVKAPRTKSARRTSPKRSVKRISAKAETSTGKTKRSSAKSQNYATFY